MRILLCLLVCTSMIAGKSGWADQTRIPNYDKARGLVWSNLYPDKNSGQPYSDLYCGFDFMSRDDLDLQVEHAFPANWFATALGCGTRDECQADNERFNHIEADLHNLWPAAAPANGARSNHSFANIPGTESIFSDCQMEKARSTFDDTPTKWVIEPRRIAKGNVARSIFYMAKEYDLPIEDRLVPILKEWNRIDKVSPDERRRNDLIEDLQGTRNRYIDDPDLVDEF